MNPAAVINHSGYFSGTGGTAAQEGPKSMKAEGALGRCLQEQGLKCRELDVMGAFQLGMVCDPVLFQHHTGTSPNLVNKSCLSYIIFGSMHQS